MLALFLMAALAAGPRIADGGAPLRQYCAADAPAVTSLEAGAAVAIRSSISGESGVCYRVVIDGQAGYVFAGELAGLEDYEAARRGAGSAALPAEMRVAAARAPTGSSVGQAVELLEARQPRQALQLFEYALASEGAEGATILALAGLAALQSDQPAKARHYFRRSLALETNPQVAALAARAERESANDTSDHVLRGSRFVLRYDQISVASSTAAVMVGALESEYARLDAALGCDLGEQVTVVVQTPERYRAATGAAEWSGGQYDGRIRVAAPRGATVTGDLQRTFAHEIVHACLARRGNFPAWFHEGMAQLWSGERLTGPQRRALNEKLAAGALPGLGELGGAWGGMTPERAGLTYAYALAAVEALYETRGDAHVRELLQQPGRLAQTAVELTRALGP
jgi:hypothetical protein